MCRQHVSNRAVLLGQTVLATNGHMVSEQGGALESELGFPARWWQDFRAPNASCLYPTCTCHRKVATHREDSPEPRGLQTCTGVWGLYCGQWVQMLPGG